MEKILKFGGTSCGSIQSIEQVVSIIEKNVKSQSQFSVVFSAMSGVTNQLLEAGSLASKGKKNALELVEQIENRHFEVIKHFIPIKGQSQVIANIRNLVNELKDVLKGITLLKEISPKSSDLLVSFGERLSTTLIFYILREKNLDVEFVDAREIIKTNDEFGKSEVDFTLSNPLIQSYFTNLGNKIGLVTGFIGSNTKGETTTLGRGGSDYTASIIGAALGVKEVEIWTDVDGIMTADPRKVSTAFTIPSISYAEAMELTHFGAKVIYPPSLQPAFQKEIPIRVLNTFNADFKGTIVTKKPASSKYIITGISSIDQLALVNLQGSGMVGVAGVSAKLFSVLSKEKVSVILISQASSEHSICFAIEPQMADKVKSILTSAFEKEIQDGDIEGIEVQRDLSVIAIVGEGMKKHTGVSGKLFSVLGKNGINIVATAQGSSELNISVVIAQKDLSKALNVIHETFFFSQLRSLHLYLVGAGLIGKTLLKQLAGQEKFLANYRGLKVKLVGIANSRKQLIDEAGIPINEAIELLNEKGNPNQIDTFIEKIKELNLPNAVFADCTADKEIYHHYLGLFKSNISVVTPNKVANSGPYKQYAELHQTALQKGVKFLYETNVGAGLPVINTLQGLIASGDRFEKIEGVLSGTLSFIFNQFVPGKSFMEVVKQAKEKGYTEPDPREDLSGMDVARKILILSREIGLKLEFSDITIEKIIPANCENANSVDSFFEELDKSNAYFENLVNEAHQNGKKLRYIAALENNKITIGLRQVDSSHPFYQMDGADNVIAFTTKRYHDRPLVIKGPGAGAEVTASGVFADIVSLGNLA
ncbi:bifunctional aspartate kinase/homoserine dehydrogenase I [Sandaracinomonas limnophila]|uniref:Bifunctional aspartate kinase/homoserine dehydrogenase I n=1 Tax=Sandaracinomonas limnophila TaxID=1862386 RepID=A0A437PW35_9BACT|nr:bifunctional aspartate kinase/homoserine dehydrogenase I [Sandaracinomonas limnophila]RVU26464.1 bifunctional aspartate kinase/homoserine dehydrogenase I [Sandaracinomonas limnophila]